MKNRIITLLREGVFEDSNYNPNKNNSQTKDRFNFIYKQITTNGIEPERLHLFAYDLPLLKSLIKDNVIIVDPNTNNYILNKFYKNTIINGYDLYRVAIGQPSQTLLDKKNEKKHYHNFEEPFLRGNEMSEEIGDMKPTEPIRNIITNEEEGYGDDKLAELEDGLTEKICQLTKKQWKESYVVAHKIIVDNADKIKHFIGVNYSIEEILDKLLSALLLHKIITPLKENDVMNLKGGMNEEENNQTKAVLQALIDSAKYNDGMIRNSELSEIANEYGYNIEDEIFQGLISRALTIYSKDKEEELTDICKDVLETFNGEIPPFLVFYHEFKEWSSDSFTYDKEVVRQKFRELTEDPNQGKLFERKLTEMDEGSFTEWCKANGFKDGASESCAKKAMSSNNKALHKKATFYMNTVKPNGDTTKDINENKKRKVAK